MFIDTHIHLDDNRYLVELDKVIKEAKQNGVSKIITMGCDYKSSVMAVEIANRYDEVYAMIGIHPSEIKKCSEEELRLDWIKELASNPRVIGIGEIGLDYYWDKTYNDLQKEIFIKQIELSKELNFPISVHSRDANQDTLDIMKLYKPKGVIHCFSGSSQMAAEFVKLGLFIGVGGVVTFKNSRVIKEVVEKIDLKWILTETDGPYLAPSPYRGTQNFPKYIPIIAEEISKIKEIDIKEVEKQVEENVNRLFNI